MDRTLSLWITTVALVGGGLLWGSTQLGAGGGLSPRTAGVLAIARWEGLALLALAAVAVALRLRGPLRGGLPAGKTAERVTRHPFVSLFVISFVVLFVELLLIRYANSQIRIFAFYKNVPLIGAFLGLGLGCSLSRGGRREVLLLLVWLVPVVVFLTGGSLVLSSALGKLAAIGSTEHILGAYVPQETDQSRALVSQWAIAGFCVATLVVVTLLFALLGRILGQGFEVVARLPGYTANILGSLAGILGFSALSYLETPPWVWFAIGLAPLLWWLGHRRDALAAAGLIGLSSLAVFPTYGDTVWSRYQKLVGHPINLLTSGPPEAYLVEISDVFYQVAVDRSPAGLKRMQRDPFPHYSAIWEGLPRPERVLIVGAGTGNDVAASLHAGAQRIDAVDIDPAIIEMGRRHHPERPYDDPRVQVLVDDARHAFRKLPAASYDAVVFGLLDSHTQLGSSSLRLDNYVFTLESLAEAKRLIRPGGNLIISAATFQPWFRERFSAMMEATVGGPVRQSRHGVWSTWVGRVEERSEPAPAAEIGTLPSDDWPFLYLPERRVPAAYLWVVGAMAVASIVMLRAGGLDFGRLTPYHGHLFFLGAAFLLMEVHAINRLALLFGTTWLVSAVAIGLVLSLIVLANFTVMAFRRIPYVLAYAGLAISLGVSFAVQPEAVLGGGTATGLALGAALLSPVYFAGLVFARSFAVASVAGPAIGANILGSVLGGWVEYATMALGIRALVLLAASFYALSLVMLLVRRHHSQTV